MAKSKAQHHKNVKPLTDEQAAGLRKKLEARQSLSEQDYVSMLTILATLLALQQAYLNSKAKLRALLASIFGPKTEKDSEKSPKGEVPPKPNRGQKGRNKGEDFPGATFINCDHTELKEGDICPDCQIGVLKESDRRQTEFFDGAPSIGLIIYCLQTFICSSCRKVFTAPLPAETPPVAQDLSKLEETDAACHSEDDLVGDVVTTKTPSRLYSIGMVLSLIMERFFKAVPHYRLAQVMQMAGIPLSTSTQYTILKSRFEALALAIFEVLKQKAANQPLFINDDTPFRILEYERHKGSGPEPDKKPKKLKPQTSAVVAKGDVIYCLFSTSPGGAGRFLDTIIEARDPSLPKLLHMSDGHNVNNIKKCEVLRGRCFDHSRRKFHDVKVSFPAEWLKARTLFGAIYKADADAKELGLNDLERMQYHQMHSEPKFMEILEWCELSLKDKVVEPNSGLGKAMEYFMNQAEELKTFLEVPGMPLSSIEVERLIKRFVLLRKNCLQFNTQKGADLGDAIMSIIATCVANQINPQAYLKTLLENARQVLKAPEEWLPSAVGTAYTYPKGHVPT